MSLHSGNALDRILERVERVPPAPPIVRKVMEIVRKPEARIQDVVKVVMLDEVLTFRILRLANSAYYRRGGSEIRSIGEALVRLGSNALINMVVAESCSASFKEAGEGYDLKRGELWRHSIGCALLSQRIAEKTGFADRESLFTACIVHDLGKTLLDSFVLDRRQEIMDRLARGGLTFTQAEMEVLGLSHNEIGARLLERWGFAPEITAAVRFHHEPDKAPPDALDLAGHVCMADMVTLMLGVGLGMDGLSYEGRRETWERFSLTEADMQRFFVQLLEEMSKAEEWLRI